MPLACPLGIFVPSEHLRPNFKFFFFPLCPQSPCDQPGRPHLSEFSQLLLQVENLEHAQPHSSEGQQDQQGDHQEASAPPFPVVVPWLFPPVGHWWWERSSGGWWGAGSTCIGTAIHPKNLGVYVVQVLLHGWEWDGLDVSGAVFHMAAKNCRGCPRLSLRGRPISAFIRLHHSSSEHSAQMLQLYESLKHQQQTPKSFRPRLQVRGTRLLLPHRGSTRTHSRTNLAADCARTKPRSVAGLGKQVRSAVKRLWGTQELRWQSGAE